MEVGAAFLGGRGIELRNDHLLRPFASGPLVWWLMVMGGLPWEVEVLAALLLCSKTTTHGSVLMLSRVT